MIKFVRARLTRARLALPRLTRATSARALIASITCFGVTSALLAQGEGDDWWAYRPLTRPAVPAVQDAGWARGAIDRFVLAGLEARGLEPAAAADKHALLRRVTYDLTGLPPTAGEIVAFLADESPDAYDRVVERLLSSEQYGVKWARHWLDLVRYAETDGYERDNKKPFIWRYRDWVVDAFNADMPYQDFLTKQLAGDELANATVADRIATGYYRLGISDDEPTDRLQARYDDLDGIADTTGRVMLGISMGCARCHDHKKDPLLARDYYSFLAFFENLEPYDRQSREVPVDGAEDVFEREMNAFEARRQDIVTRIRGVAEAARAATSELDRARLLEDARADVVARYSGDELHATVLRDEYGNRDGVIEGQVVEVDGRMGSAMRFDGDDAVLLPRVVQSSFTVSFFVRSDQPGPGQEKRPRWFQGAGLVDGEVRGITRDWGVSWYGDGRIAAGVGQPETFLASGSGHHDGEWHHVAFTRDRDSGRAALYVDGVLADSKQGNTKALNAPQRLVVGRSAAGGRFFRGDLDELQFFSRALAPGEVAALALGLRDGIAAPAMVRALPAGSGDVDGRAAAFDELQGLTRPVLPTVEILCVSDKRTPPEPSFVRVRGSAHVKGDEVEPAFPGMLTPRAPVIEDHRRRTALARWITDANNVLTWRVIGNRLWQFHFGRGLSRFPNDFGRLGEHPTHPELLDWLACEVKAQGGSLKAMHRLIVLSSTYRMSSAPRPAAAVVDPRNDAFWRFDRRRLTAEEIRDTILTMSNELNPQLGGPWVYPPLPPAVLATASRPDAAWGRSSPEQAARRSLYVHTKRSLPEPLLAGFDKADTDNSCPVRFATVQATQALTMLNGDFAQEQAARFALRLQSESSELRAQLALGLRLVTQRPERAADLDRLLALHRDLVRDHGRTAVEALQRCCLVLLNCNEMIYID